MSLVAVGATQAADLEAAVHVFEAVGFRTVAGFAGLGEGDLLVPLGHAAPETLREADGRGLKYVLVHVGPDDGVAGGSFARSHHRTDVPGLAALAEKLRGRERLLVSILAFGYRHGLPAEADWVIDARFLKNPYWVPELRDLDGRDPGVSDFVLDQPAARELLDHLAAVFAAVIPEYRRQGRTALRIAIGCTGGRHRSVALAADLARRLEALGDADVEPGFREL